MSDNSNSLAIQADAKKLAEQYHVDASRVTDILAKTRITEEWNPIAGYKYVENKVKDRARYWPLLEDALEDMGPKALDLFEADPPDVLSNRLMWLYRLMWSGLPVYTREGLIYLTEAFIQNQEANREHLIATGYRDRVLWEKFPWLEERLGNLYPVKAPTNIEPTKEFPGQLTYTWSTSEGESCSYEDAPIFDVISPEQAEEIEPLRPELFARRLEALRRLLSILKEGPYDELDGPSATSVLDLYQDVDLDLLVLVDNLLSGKGKVPNAKPGRRKSIAITGGLSNILEVACHYVSESTVGLYHETKAIFWNSFSEAKNGRPQFNGTPFAAISQLTSEEYALLGKLTALIVEQNHLTDEEKLRLIGEIKSRPGSTQTPLLPEIENLLTPVAGQIEGSYNGRCANDNFFVKRGTIWNICYGTEFVTIPDQRGLGYIAYLLDAPNKSISAHSLMFACGLIKASKIDIGKRNKKSMSPYVDDSPVSDYGIDDLADPSTIRNLKERVDFLQEQLKTKHKANSNAEVSDIKAELEFIRNYIKQSTGKSGKSRKVGDSHAKYTNTVYQAIKRCIGQIHRYHSALANHLDDSIERKTDFVYRPVEQTTWLVEP
ncbi:MAG: hypothetical protein KQJ78_25695 [Deltaproteobacteria bacterium]|nr:hypothetical protein [Deltaproteobacteria bacterium]